MVMNEFKIIEQQFAFLAEQGFSKHRIKTNLEYALIYRAKQTSIVLSYDLRTHIFDIDVIRHSAVKEDIHVPLLDLFDDSYQEKQELIQALNRLYVAIEKDWTITKTHFTAMVNLYAEFVKKHLQVIN